VPAGNFDKSKNQDLKMGIFHPKNPYFRYFVVKNIDINKDNLRNKGMPLGKKLENQ